MSYAAESVVTFGDPPDVVFDRLADARRWREWMPRAFRPTRVPDAPLRVGDRLRVRVAYGPPSTLTVTVADRGRELTWTGGVRGVLFAEHRFLFERAADGSTVVRSVETWSGVIADALRPVVQRLAVRIGRAQLQALRGEPHLR